MSTVRRRAGRRRPHEVRRAEQAHLLAREGGEDERPRRTRRRGKCPGECHHRRRAGGIVVRSGMDGAGLVGRQRPFAAPAQMIVVRADDDGLVREARIGTREHCHHVRRHGAVADQADLDPDPRARQRQRARGEASIDGLGQLGQAHAGRRQERVGARACHADGDNAQRLADAGKLGERVRPHPGMSGDDDGPRAVLARIDDLVAPLRVVVGGRVPEGARRIGGARLLAQDQDDLASHVEPRIVVIAEVGSGDSVSGEGEVARLAAVGGHGQRHEVPRDGQ